MNKNKLDFYILWSIDYLNMSSLFKFICITFDNKDNVEDVKENISSLTFDNKDNVEDVKENISSLYSNGIIESTAFKNMYTYLYSINKNPTYRMCCPIEESYLNISILPINYSITRKIIYGICDYELKLPIKDNQYIIQKIKEYSNIIKHYYKDSKLNYLINIDKYKIVIGIQKKQPNQTYFYYDEYPNNIYLSKKFLDINDTDDLEILCKNKKIEIIGKQYLSQYPEAIVNNDDSIYFETKFIIKIFKIFKNPYNPSNLNIYTKKSIYPDLHFGFI